MSDTELSTARHRDAVTTATAWPPPADALYSDRIWLLQHDPEQYFAMYPRVDLCEYR